MAHERPSSTMAIRQAADRSLAGAIAPIVGVAILLGAVSAWANDFTAGGDPADLVPLDESRIAMQSEDIVMEYRDGEWLVSANYVFRNSTDEAITQRIGFPELGCDPNEGFDCVDDAFKGLRTVVGGKSVQHTKGKIDREHPWSEDLGTVWLFDATFAPRATTDISHSYTVFTGSNLSFVYGISYVVKTGRGWQGKIGSARFRVKLPPAAHTVGRGDFTRPPEFKRDADGSAYYLLERRNTDWVPPTSIGTSVIFTAWSDINERLGEDRFARSGVREEDECVSPTTPKSAAQAQMCKNLIYALSGYPFKSEKLRKYFYGNQFDWRREKDHWVGDVWVRGLRPFEGFRPEWIPALESGFIRYIDTLHFDDVPSAESLPAAAAKALAPADTRADEKLKKALKSPEKAGATRKTQSRLKPQPAVKPRPSPAPTHPPVKKPTKKAPSGCAMTSPSPTRSFLPYLSIFFVAAFAYSRRIKRRPPLTPSQHRAP